MSYADEAIKKCNSFPMKKDSDSSISFLETIFGSEKSPIKSNLPIRTNTNVIVDTVFINLEIKIPKSIEKFFKDVEKVDFVYSFSNLDQIEILDLSDNKILYKISVDYFESFPFQNNSTEIIFILGKNDFKKKCKLEMNRNFKKSLDGNKKFIEVDRFEILKKKFINYQIENSRNFVFINDPRHLHMQIKNLVHIIKTRTDYFPKVKKADDKTEFLNNFLQKIPGVSENISAAILNKYRTFDEIQDSLIGNREMLELKVFDKNGENYRNISVKLFERLKKVFLSEESNEKL